MFLHDVSEFLNYQSSRSLWSTSTTHSDERGHMSLSFRNNEGGWADYLLVRFACVNK